jgi:speckle-type POZ protein
MTVGCYSETKKRLPNGRCVRPNAIDAGGHSWRIAFYPNGRHPDTTDCVSVFLQLDGTDAADAVGADYHVEFRFMLLQVAGGPPFFASDNVEGAFSAVRTEIGFERLVPREAFERSRLLEHDCFSIRCDLTVLSPAAQSRASSEEPAVVEMPPPCAACGSGMRADLARLLETTHEGTDVEFEVRGGKVFAAHKLVLAARSPVFKAEFFGGATLEDEKTTSYVRVRDTHPDAFEALLHYIYTDSLPATVTTKARGEGAAAASLGRDLLAAADRYRIEDLKSATEDALCDHAGLSNVLPMLATAERHRCQKLKRTCLEFTASRKNTRKIIMAAAAADGDVEDLARSCPSVVKEVIVEVLDTREATPSNPLVVSVHNMFYLYVFTFIILLALLGLAVCFPTLRTYLSHPSISNLTVLEGLKDRSLLTKNFRQKRGNRGFNTCNMCAKITWAPHMQWWWLIKKIGIAYCANNSYM